MQKLICEALAAQEHLVCTKKGGSVSVSEAPTSPELGVCVVFSYDSPYGAPKDLVGDLTKIVGRAFDVPGAGEQGVLYLPLDNAMWNDEEMPFIHKGRHLYDSMPSEKAVRQGQEVVVGLLSCEAAKEELKFVLFMGADNARMNKELARLGCIPGVQGSHVKDITQDLTDSPRPFGLKDGSALEVYLPGATQPQVWLSMVHAGAYPIYLERLSAANMYLEVPQGIDSAMKALRRLSGQPVEGAVSWAMVPGGGKGMTDEDKAEMERLARSTLRHGAGMKQGRGRKCLRAACVSKPGSKATSHAHS